MAVRDCTSGKIKDHQEMLLHIDGGCEPNPGGVAVSAWAAYDTQGNLLAEEVKVVRDGDKLATNNFAEYCGLGLALRWLLDQGWKGSLRVKSDSKLLVGQVLGDWKCKVEHLKTLRNRIWELMEQLHLQRIGETEQGMMSGPDGDINPTLSPCVLTWVPREQNSYADSLCCKARAAYLQQKRKPQ